VWIVRRCRRDEARFFVRANYTQQFDVAEMLGKNLAGPGKAKYCARIPGNQLFHLHTQTKQVALPGLPSALEGFSIAHLSDLHFAGHVQREFHEEVVRQTNALDADIIAITGDIIDRPHCFEWFASTLGQLRARRGVYFILGNHDGRRTKPDEVRRALVALGLIDLGGQSALIEHHGGRVLLVGNELPWMKAPPETSVLPVSPRDPSVLSVLLSHSPDQFAWAQREGYQLMLAGHVHGGQIRLPIVGPLLSPSRYGVRYACGFFMGRPTLMHVTRGVSGLIPLRFNCPPEVAKLVLHASV
jgi:predicted MPP superfamily phosphohydrolase